MTPQTPWDAAILPVASSRLYVQVLSDIPEPPLDLEAVLRTRAPIPPVAWLDRIEPLETVKGQMVTNFGRVRIPYEPGKQPVAQTWAVAIVHGDPPDLVLAVARLPGPLFWDTSMDFWDAELMLVVSRTTGA